MTRELPSFQQYQLAFTQYLRDPKHQPRPKDVSAKRIAIYEEIVFNNLFESVSACFPVARKVLGSRAWLKLTRTFLCNHSASSPLFREIPEEFLAFLSTQSDLPAYLMSLCHYEWVELAVSSDNTSINFNEVNQVGNLLDDQPVFTPSMRLLNYDYAVQNISSLHKPKQQLNTQLLVYRNVDDAVKFVELNPVTFRLIELLLQNMMTGRHALTQIAEELAHPEPESVIGFGLEILEDLRNQGAILGIKRH